MVLSEVQMIPIRASADETTVNGNTFSGLLNESYTVVTRKGFPD